MTASGDSELARLSAELTALTLRDHASLENEIRAAATRMRRLSRPGQRWYSALLGTGVGARNDHGFNAVDRELEAIAIRIGHLGETARGRALVLRRLAEKAARANTNTHIAGMNAAFIKAAAARAAIAEDMAADAADRFLTQALPLWRTTRAHGNRQMRQAAGAVQAALDALSASIEQGRTASAPVERAVSS